jgi:hypothetical protein
VVVEIGTVVATGNVTATGNVVAAGTEALYREHFLLPVVAFFLKSLERVKSLFFCVPRDFFASAEYNCELFV